MVDRNISSMAPNVYSYMQDRINDGSYDEPRHYGKQNQQQFLSGYEKVVNRLSDQAEMPHDDRQDVPDMSNPNTQRTVHESNKIPDERYDGGNRKIPISRSSVDSGWYHDPATRQNARQDNASFI